MSDLKRWLSGLIGFLGGTSAVLAADTGDGQSKSVPTTDRADDSAYTRAVRLRNTLRSGAGWVLAAHRSHSSHSSHRSHSSHQSHYSGSGGSYSPAPVYTPPASAAPPSTTPRERQGFTATPAKPVQPSAPAPDAAAAEVAKLIMRIQLALNSRGYCGCSVDGKFGQVTVQAIKKFQKDNALNVTGLPDTETLKKLEVAF